MVSDCPHIIYAHFLSILHADLVRFSFTATICYVQHLLRTRNSIVQLAAHGMGMAAWDTLGGMGLRD